MTLGCQNDEKCLFVRFSRTRLMLARADTPIGKYYPCNIANCFRAID